MCFPRRYRNLFTVAIKNITANRAQGFAVAVPLSLIIAIVSAITFYMEGVERDALLAANSLPDLLLQQQVGGRTESLLYSRYTEVLEKIPAIEAAVPRIWGYINYQDKNQQAKAFVLMGMDPEFIRENRLFSAVVQEGRMLTANDENQAMIGAVVAEAFGAAVGDEIRIQSPDLRRDYPLEVVGTFDADVQIYAADLVLVPLDTARKILGYYEAEEYSDVMLFLSEPMQAERVAETISGKIDGARPITKQTMLSLTRQSFGQRSGYFYLLWLILLVNVLIIAWSVMVNLSHNQKQQIGILKAIGWGGEDIMVLKVMEVCLIGAAGVGTGLLGGLAYMMADAPGLKRLIIGWADIYPDFPIPLYVEWQSVSFIAALGMVPLLAAALIPVWRSSLIDPAEMIRAGD